VGSGRCFTADPERFRGQLDLLVDDVCSMGSVSVSDLPSRQLRVAATGLPSGGTVRIVQGPVDLAGSGVPDPRTKVTAYPTSAFGTGGATFPIDTTASMFVRVEVSDSAGTVIASTNPVWMLRSIPPFGIPEPRSA
jgi:hypothetical protein